MHASYFGKNIFYMTLDYTVRTAQKGVALQPDVNAGILIT